MRWIKIFDLRSGHYLVCTIKRFSFFMFLRYTRSIYIDRFFYFLVISLLVLLLSIIIFCFSAYARTLSDSVKKDVTSTFLKQKKPEFNKNLSLFSHDKKKKSSPHLLTESGSESSLWSNAFNFKKTIDTQTDPRTGMLFAHIKVGSLLSNEGHGPDIDLEANYNSGTTVDPDGLGYGWSWNLTHFNPVTNQLTTSTGQNFYLKKRHDQWLPLYHKLQDIRIDGDKKNAFVITYANGLRETLNHDGYETKLQQQNGWSVHFTYIPGTHLLQFIADDQGHYITLHYKNDNIHVTNKNAHGEPVILIINKSKDEIQNISFQSPQHYIISGLHIRYMKHLITQIDYPTGLTKRFYYGCKSAMKIPGSNNYSGYALCVVTKVSVDPGASQPVITIHYYYSQADYNGHNYLGFNSGLYLVNGSAKDILFEAPANYTYQTATDNGLIKEIRTYNKYHLLINDKKISIRTGKKLSEVQTFFCQRNNSDGCAHTSFVNLPVYYSLPLKIITKLWSDGAVYPAISTETIYYDKYGRAIHHKDSYGRLTVIKYCPKKGDNACPPVPHGWLVGALTESVTKYPAAVKTEEAIPPPVIMHNYYRKIPAYTGNGYTNVLDHQVTCAKQQYRITKYNYYQDPENPFLYGLLKQTIFTGNINKVSSVASVNKHYHYIKSLDNHAKTAYTTVDLQEGKSQLSSTITTSLFTNQTLQITDATGLNIIRYHYDFMGRLIRTDHAVGTPFAVSNYYTYTVSPTLNQVLITSQNKLQEKTIFDGAGRMLMHFNQAIAVTGQPVLGRWFPVQKISYDHYGYVLAEHAYIMQNPDRVHEFTTTQDYDDSGRVIRKHLSDNREIITEYDDADRCVVHYEKSSAGKYSVISVVHANRLYQPIMSLLLPAPVKPPSTAYRLCHLSADTIQNQYIKVSATIYDAFGRAVKKIDPLGHSVKVIYNALGSVTDIINPKGDRVHRVYDLSGHIIQSWAYPVSGDHYLLSSAKYNNAGELLWSAGEDNCHSVFTYNANGQLLSMTNPAGHTLSFQYNVLGLPVSKSLDGKLQLQLFYEPVTALLIKKEGITGTTTFLYDADGLMRKLIHSGKNGYSDYRLSWEYDINRRLVSMTNIAGNQIQMVYDRQGRIQKMVYQPLKGKAEVTGTADYDDFSRIEALHYGSGMNRKLRYDAFGHLLETIDMMSNRLLYDEHFYYDANDNITTIIQKTNQNEYAKLNYHYDSLNNLVSMLCKGSDGLSLCPRDTNLSGSGLIQAPVIIRQNYTFTPLNRLASVREILQDSSAGKTINKEMDYHYSNPQVPLRLQETGTIWNNKSTVTHHFDYDVMGNMITDGEGDHLFYNASNQIVQVNKTDGQHSYYSYDSNNRIVKTASAGDTRYLFYQGEQLINEKISSPQQSTHIIGYLGVAKTIDSVIQTYNETDYKGDVVGVLNKVKGSSHHYNLSQSNIYSPYGMVFHRKNNSLPLYQKTLYGFDGELTDPATGWQFLGNGHRAYNPEMRYFTSEDPSGDGYGFGSNNPIMNSDPSGNTPEWLGSMFKWFENIASFGLNALHAKWTSIASTVIMAGLTVVTLGATAASYGGAALGVAVAGGAAVYSSVPVIAASVPPNKGLNMAASFIGLTEAGIMLATAAVDMGFFLSASLPVSSPEMSEIEMCNFKMLKICKPACRGQILNVDMPLQILREKAAAYIIKVDGGDALNLKNMHEVANVWKALKSQDNDLIVCDTAVFLMTAEKTRNPLLLSDLESFYKKKYTVLSNAGGGTKDQMVDFLRCFKSILKNLNPHEYYVPLNRYNISTFSSILRKPRQIAVLQHPYHVGVVERGSSNKWFEYVFLENGDSVRNQNRVRYIERNFFAMVGEEDSINPYKIDAYMMLPYRDDDL